mmetsp:Transcript_2966/g.3344  ORF Transcript_2966/g.3344 Transcript_2966/m.3344 type:complete len:1294 (+) Transcript_2966:140-4021(+)
MDELESFTEVMDNLKGFTKSRDPRSIRIGHVISALTDVIEGDVIAVKVYASTVTTLEGTLHQDHADVNVVLDSLTTQAALLKILGVVVPHVSAAALGATIGLTSRVLRGVVSSSVSILANDNQGSLLDTNDGLGALTTVLCDTCMAVAEVLRYLTPSSVEESAVKQLLTGTLLGLLQDTREKVQNTAKDALSGLLMMGSPKCHPTILKATTKYVNMHIDNYLKNPSNQNENRDMIELAGFLGTSLISLNFTAIGGRLMTILIDLLNEESLSSPARPVFVANSHGSTLKILTLNSILSIIMSLLEADDEVGMKKIERINSFSARVLATLVQARPTLSFREGAAEIDLLESGRTIYGQILISSTQRVLNSTTGSNVEIGAKILPMVLQQLLALSQPIEEDDLDNGIAKTLFLEVSQLFRVQMQLMLRGNPKLHKICSQNCLSVLKSVIKSPFNKMHTPVLECLALLLQQMELEDEVVLCIQSLIKIRCDDTTEQDLQRQIESAFISLIQGIGVEQFWKIIDFPKLCKTSSNSAPNQYSWLIDVMKVSGLVVTDNQLHLSFFQDEALPLAREFDALSVKSSTGTAICRSQVINMWNLFPVFCRRPVDLDVALPKLAPILIKALNDQRYPEFVTVICTGLDTLTNGVVDRKDELKELIDGDEGSHIRMEVEVMGRVSLKLLPSLFKLVDSLHNNNSNSGSEKKSEDTNEMDTDTTHEYIVEKDATGVLAVTRSIASIARVAPNAQIQRLFTKVVQRMLESSQSDDTMNVGKMCSLLSLSQALVSSECLEDSSISLLYRSLKPIIRTDETPSRIQKRAYKVMSEICNRYHSFVAEPERLKEVMELLSSTSATSQVSARFMRLKCLTFVVDGFKGSACDIRQGITSSLIGETLLCLKDYNAKTRDAGFKLLLSMNRIHGSSANFIRMVAAAVGSKTSHMRSAAVTALSKLVFEFSSEDFEVHSMLPALLKTVLILSDDPSREVTKSMVVFVRVTVSAASSEQLETLLPDILNGLLKYHRGKDRFREKIKIIIKKLVKLFGFEALTPFVPQSNSRLLTHMRKLSEREARRKKTRRNQQSDDTRDYEDMADSDEEDSDDGRTLVTGMTKMSRMSRMSSRRTLKRRHIETSSLAQSTKSMSKSTVRIKNDTDGNVTDVKDLKTVRFSESPSEESEFEEDMEFDSSGKLVVHDIDELDLANNMDDGDTILSFKSKRSTSERSSLTRKKDSTKKKKASNNGEKLGSAYKSKKAGGDTKKIGQKFEPYAYMRLDGRNYSKKNRRNAVDEMSAVVRGGKKRLKTRR